MTGDLQLEPVTTELPDGISVLRSDAEREGFGFLERLARQWESGEVRFDQPGEALFIARHGGTIAGIGGITVDPFAPTALRMRRFYVRPDFRRHGIARHLASALLAHALATGRPLTVNAGTDVAPAFWERMGFTPVDNPHHTHVWPTGAGLMPQLRLRL